MWALVFFVLFIVASVAHRVLTSTKDEPVLPPDPEPIAIVPVPVLPVPAPATASAPAPEPVDPAGVVVASDMAPPSLRGTEVDGRIEFRDGRLLPTRELRRLFDYFLTAIGEKPLEDIRNWFIAHVREQHGDFFVPEVLTLFDQYVGLLQAAEQAGLATLDDRGRLATLKALRKQWLGEAAAAAFYGDEEAYLTYTLDRLDVLKDRSLDTATRTERLRALDATRPEGARAAEDDATLGMLVDEQTRQLDAIGADADTRMAEREALLGKPAAERLAALDAERAQWQRRIDDYKRAVASIRADAALDERTRTARLEALLNGSFDETERRRVSSLEAIGQL